MDRRVFLGLAAAVLAATTAPGHAQSDFYAGKTLTIVVGAGPGGVETHARLVAQHLGRHIPGNPNVIVQNMPGGGGILAANYIFNAATPDGLVIGNSTPAMLVEERLGTEGVQYETLGFNWLGKVGSGRLVTFVRDDVPVDSFEEALTTPIKLGTTGVGSTVYLFPKLANDVLDAKFDLITGYPDTANLLLAMEQGEIDGTTIQWDSVKSLRPEWIADGSIKVLVQYAGDRHPELPDVPSIIEQARTDEARALFDLMATSTLKIGRSFIAPPGTPEDRVQILRDAFDKLMEDPDYAAAVANIGATLDRTSGADLQALLQQEVYPDEIIALARRVREGG